MSVAKKPAESGQIGGGTYQKYLADAGKHEYRQRIIHHGLVVNRDKLFGDCSCYGCEAGAGAPGENDSFHRLAYIFL